MSFLQDPATALIVVDIQNDFLPGGALPVPQGDEVIAPINRLIENAFTVVLTADWHPSRHKSFAINHSGKKPFELVDMPYGKQVCGLRIALREQRVPLLPRGLQRLAQT